MVKFSSEAVDQYLKITPKHRKKDVVPFLADILENTSQPFGSAFPDGRMMYCNQAFCNLLGYTKEELNNISWKDDLTPPEWRNYTDKVIKELHTTGKPQRYEKEYVHKDGTKIPIELFVHRACDEHSNIIFHHSFITDIRQRVEMNNQLEDYRRNLERLVEERTSELVRVEEQSKELLEVLLNYYAILDREGRLIDASKDVERYFGRRKEQVIGKVVWDVFPEIKNRYQKVFEKVVSENKPVIFETDGVVQPKKWFEVTFYPAGGKILVCFRDVSERKKMQGEMNKLDSLHIIGQMAAGIGHEIRNPMTSVKGFLQLLGSKETDSKKKEYYDLMVDELDRANFIITEFLSLAKDRHVELRPRSLNRIITLLYPLLNSDAALEDKVILFNNEELPDILLDENEIRQLIINLVRNAVEASPPGGVVHITTTASSDEVILSIEDEGKGIPQEIFDKLGTPFVTTKENGTGLGLSVCYSIAHKHHAMIDVKTSSTGTTFFVLFNIPVRERSYSEESLYQAACALKDDGFIT